ncbi:MAG TPA: MFS transporter [Acidimicrobiia bacterium]|nr:MFS transporter [Acidimicrobiia bacterium]
MTLEHSRSFRFGMGAGLFAITAVAFLRAPLLPAIGRDLGLSALGLGGLGSAFALGRLTADFPAGALTDRSRPGAMMAIAAAIVAAGSLLFGLSPVALVAFVAAFGLGIGSTWTLTGSMAFFARAPRVSRGMSMSFFAAALLVGQAVGPALGGLMGAVWDWRVAMVVGAVVAAALVPLFLANPGVAPDTENDDDGARERRPIPRRVLAVLYLLPAVQFSIGAAMIQTLVPIVGDDELGLGTATIGLAIGIGGIARLIGAIVSGRVSDSIGRKWALVPGLSLQTAGLVVFALAGGTIAWWLAILGLTLGSVAVNVGSTILADLTEEGGLGKRLGAFRFAGDLAFLVTPLLSGALYEVSGRFLGTLPLLALTATATLGALFVLPETIRRPA